MVYRSIKRMTSILKYRIIGLTLAVIFAVFNVGLPVVVASCPMMKYSDSKQCMMCDDGASPGTLQIKRAVDTSCCAIKYAADRNETEFIQLKAIDTLGQAIVDQVVCDAFASDLRSSVCQLQCVDSSPPQTQDIPIFVSSLLI